MADYTVTAANVKNVDAVSLDSGVTAVGVTITAGMSVYKKASDGLVYLADADVQFTAAEASSMGVALHASLAGQPITWAKGDGGTINCGFVTTVGTDVFVSTGAGGICPRADVLTGDYIYRIGFITASNVLTLDCKAYGVAVP